MEVHLSAAHWVYLVGIVVVLVTMAFRKNIVVPAVLATFLTAFVFSDSLVTGLASIFNASLIAAKELFSIFLIIAMVTAMLGALQQMGSDRLMVAPFRRVMRSPMSSFLVLGAVTYVISLFFWPTPAVPLVGAVLIPVAIRAGLSPMSVGMVVAICGQGMALSSDYIIKVAPGISAAAAGADPDVVADKSLVLSLIVGAVAMILTYVFQRRTWRKPSSELLTEWESEADRTTDIPVAGELDDPADGGTEATGTDSSGGIGGGGRHTTDPVPTGGPSGGGSDHDSSTAVLEKTAVLTSDAEADDPTPARKSTVFAVLVPLVFAGFMIYLILGKFTGLVPSLQGGDAAAIVGGLAALILFAAAAANDKGGFLQTTSDHLIDGLIFAFKAMGIVLPIAGFFFLGNADFSAAILSLPEGTTGPAILFDLVNAAQAHLPQNAFVTSFAILIIGMIAGLEGSGFTGLPLTGSLAGALGPAVGMDPSTLAAIGQMGNIWSGGGTLVAWSSLVAVAGFARVPVLDLARKCFIPVVTGLVICVIFATLVY